MQILPSSWATHHFWNDVQFYYLLGIVPPLVIIFIMNILYGEAELRDIPEGYVPEWWEYHRVSCFGQLHEISLLSCTLLFKHFYDLLAGNRSLFLTLNGSSKLLKRNLTVGNEVNSIDLQSRFLHRRNQNRCFKLAKVS